MQNLIKLQQVIWGLGCFSGLVKLNISLESEFEGFYGKASEDWEKRVTIELTEVKEGDIVIFPHIKVVGKRFEGIDEVAAKILKELKIIS